MCHRSVIGGPERKERKYGAEIVFQQITDNYFPILVKFMKPSRIKTAIYTPNITGILMKSKDKEKPSKAARRDFWSGQDSTDTSLWSLSLFLSTKYSYKSWKQVKRQSKENPDRWQRTANWLGTPN